ncbi:TPA: hypothetical protein N0F65_005202 [Lagenidium giganteum]|uniref:FAD-binding domain-containing protein n=1 Tax=Lagenidium giganteum TaxID=4803 RepID=A0AAV2Z1K7_9STRA|nr:TPA: hypothetical protein N0F65_005202 [Lagenidium giganteum]
MALTPRAARALATAAEQSDARDGKRVLVVGGGPIGQAMGFLLEHVYQVPTRIVERQAQPTTHPRAHFLNLRTMEVLKTTMPDFHDQLLQQAAHSNQWRHYVYCTSVGKARELARIDQFGPCVPRDPTGQSDKQALRQALAALSPTQFVHFPQNRFEQLQVAFLEKHNIHIDRRVELVDLQLPASGDERVRVTLRNMYERPLPCAHCSVFDIHYVRSDRDTNAIEHATYDYVVAGDGAHSLVRDRCGIPLVGAANLQSIINVHFMSQQLSEAAQENPAMLYFIFNEDVIAVLIAHDFQRGEWVLQIPFFPPQESIEADFSPEKCKQLIQQILPHATGSAKPRDDMQILSVGQWQMSARVAKHYDAQQRVFLVGDAAHQLPPAGGMGMNTGLQDVHNLAWKLALAVQQEREPTGQPSPLADRNALLGSYERERQPIGKLNTQLSLRNFARTMKVPSALNVSYYNAQLMSKVINAPPCSLLPLNLQRDFMKNLMKVGRVPLGWLSQDHTHPLGSRLKERVRRIVERGESLGMLFYNFDIGFSYRSHEWGARARELMEDKALDMSALFETDLDEAAKNNKDVFVPGFAVGQRFPHVMLEDATTGEQLSTLDLPMDVMRRRHDDGKVMFVLLVDGLQSAAAVLENSSINHFHEHVALVIANEGVNELDRPDFNEYFEAVSRVNVSAEGKKRWQRFGDAYNAALIRPDGHVACLWPIGTQVSSASLSRALQEATRLD